MKNNKAIILALLLITVLSFSGCSIRKVEEEAENKSPENTKGSSQETGVNERFEDVDTDGDGLLDSEEEKLGTDRNNLDTDNDELNDFDEIKKWKTDPLNSDTDGDGYLDGQEVEGGYDPLGPGQLDSDNDGLGDVDEKNAGTNPEKYDTDGDGFNDKDEIDLGRDPLIVE